MNYLSFDSLFFDIVFPIIISIGMVLWIYSIWFHSKYDKNTNRLIMLLLLNFYYVPFYLFRIRKIKKATRIIAISEDIYDSAFIEMTRTSILDSLQFWSSNERQLESQEQERGVNMSQELFEQWDSVYGIDSELLDEAFNGEERGLLKAFDQSISICNDKIGDDFPRIAEFQETNDWKVLNQLALEIIKEIRY